MACVAAILEATDDYDYVYFDIAGTLVGVPYGPNTGEGEMQAGLARVAELIKIKGM